MESISVLFSYSFMLRAVIVGALVSLCASVLGVSLVLKRYSMIGDGLSHVSFGALALSALLNTAPLLVSIPIVVISAFFLLRISENSKVGSDSLIAVFSSASLSLGIIITSMSEGINSDISSYMFGSVLSMNESDVFVSVILSVFVLIIYILFYNKIFAITFDESFSRATGVNVNFYNTIIAILTALTIVLGMRIMGSLLISSLVIFPALSAMRLFKFFRGVIIFSAIISVICFFIGLILSYYLEIPVGASVVMINLLCFFVCTLISKVKST